MKKFAVIMVLLTCGMLVTVFEVAQIKAARVDEHLPIVILKDDAEIGRILKNEDVEIKLVPTKLVPTSSFSNISEVVGKTLSIGLPSQTILSGEMIDEENYFMPSKGNSITAIKFNPEEVMCWEVTDGEILEIVHVNLDGFLSKIGDVTVKGYYNQNQSIDNESPIYLLVEGKPKIIEAIIKARGDGRLEAIKNN